MADHEHQQPGLFSSLRKICDSGLELIQTRIELFAVELREEKYFLVEIAFMAAVAFFLGIMAVMLLTIAVVIYFWEDARIQVLGGFGALYLLAGAAVFSSLRNRLKKRPKPFEETLSEIRKDRDCLNTRN